MQLILGRVNPIMVYHNSISLKKRSVKPFFTNSQKNRPSVIRPGWCNVFQRFSWLSATICAKFTLESSRFTWSLTRRNTF